MMGPCRILPSMEALWKPLSKTASYGAHRTYLLPSVPEYTSLALPLCALRPGGPVHAGVVPCQRLPTVGLTNASACCVVQMVQTVQPAKRKKKAA